MKFVNLHLHTMWSVLDSIIKPNELADKLAEEKQTAVAITDHGSLGAYYDVTKANEQQNIKTIYGCEFYCRPTYKEKTRDRQHLVILAENQEGLYNIRKLNRIAQEHSYYAKPILSYEELWKNKDGLILSSACAYGIISEYILKNDMPTAKKWANKFYEEFGDKYYLELQMHPQFKGQADINEGIVKISEELSIPTVVTADSHIIDEEDGYLRNIIEAIGYHKSLDEVYQTLYSNSLGTISRITKWAEQSGFEHDDILKKSFKNTVKIGKQCNVELEKNSPLIPKFDKYEEYERIF